MPSVDLACVAADIEKGVQAQCLRPRCRRRPDELKPARRTPEVLEAERDRVVNGLVWHGGTVAGRFVKAFREHGLRSNGHVLLRRQVAMYPRRGYIATGRAKGGCRPSPSKVLALDEPYGQANLRIRGTWRVDIDAVFRDMDHLRACLREAGLPDSHHPTLVVCDRDTPDGSIRKPHLWWQLPPGSEVWHDRTDSRCRRGPVELLKSVIAEVTERLVPYGADLGGLSNPHHGKLVTSPFWRVEVMNDAFLPSLSEWAELLDLSGRSAPAAVARRAAARQAGLTQGESNAVFDAARTAVVTRLREMDLARDPAYLAALEARRRGDRGALFHLAFDGLCGPLVEAHGPKARAVLESCARHVAGTWDPDRVRRPRAEIGAMAGTLDGMTTTQRRRAAARRTSAIRVDATRASLVAAAEAIVARGENLTKAGLAREAGVARSTVARHWDALSRGCSVRSRDRVLSASAADRETIGASPSQVEGVPVPGEEVSTSWGEALHPGEETSCSWGLSPMGEAAPHREEVSTAPWESPSLRDAYLAGRTSPHGPEEGSRGRGQALPGGAEGSPWEVLRAVEDAPGSDEDPAWEAPAEGEASPGPQGWIVSGVEGVEPGAVGMAPRAPQDGRPAHGSPSAASRPIRMVEPAHGAPGASWASGRHGDVAASPGPRERLAPRRGWDRARTAVQPAGASRGPCDLAEAIRRVGYVPRSMSDLAIALVEVEGRGAVSKPGRGW